MTGERSPTKPRCPRRRVMLALYWWEDRIFEGVARFASERGWILDCKMRWTHTVPDASSWKGDGIIANPGFSKPIGPLIDLIRQSGAPTVGLQTYGDYPAHGRVLQDHAGIAQRAADRFAELRFRQVGYVVFAENPVERIRSDAFAARAASLGMTCSEIRIDQLQQKLAGLPKPIGLMAMNDLNAISVMTTCLDAGARIPEEVSLIGVDDSRIVCDFAEIPLSSVNCNFEEQGYQAAAMLERLMNREPVPAAPIVVIPAGVTNRRSTDTIAAPDPSAARALRAIRDRFHEPIGVAEIAAEIGAPLRRLQESFREHLGFTMIQELTRVRVERAQALLADKRLKLETIASESGFSSRFHLIRAFSRITGETPASYRKRLSPTTSDAHPIGG